MKFILLDQIVLEEPDRLVARKLVSLAEEYLADHFPTFPVLPGVMMIEAMAQAARRLLAQRDSRRLVLGEVRALKYGNMVRPGEILEVEVTLAKAEDDGRYVLKGVARVIRPQNSASDGETAASGRFTMRPVDIG